METVKFHPAVELILSRMESNPSEFTYEGGKWRHTIEQHTRWMSKEEKEAVNEKLREINLDHLRTHMLRSLLKGETKVVEDLVGFGQAPIRAEGGAVSYSSAIPNATWASNSLSIGGNTITPSDAETLLKLIEEYNEKE